MLEVVVGQVNFTGDNQLRTISLQRLRSAGSLGIQSNPVLMIFNGLPTLTSLDNADACSICQGNDNGATCN